MDWHDEMREANRAEMKAEFERSKGSHVSRHQIVIEFDCAKGSDVEADYIVDTVRRKLHESMSEGHVVGYRVEFDDHMVFSRERPLKRD